MDEPKDIPTLADFIGACDASFAFLVIEHGFVRVAETMAHSPYGARYRKGELAVDVYGEGHGTLAACALVRGNDRLDYGQLLPAAERKPLPAGQLAQIAGIAARLQQHAKDFLSGDVARFNAALAEWRRTRPQPPRNG